LAIAAAAAAAHQPPIKVQLKPLLCCRCYIVCAITSNTATISSIAAAAGVGAMRLRYVIATGRSYAGDGDHVPRAIRNVGGDAWTAILAAAAAAV
jgi:hypothetical protein